jgi:hypothetical protein
MKGKQMSTTRSVLGDTEFKTVKGTHGWTYQLWMKSGHLKFRRWCDDYAPNEYQPETIWLFGVENFEIPVFMRKAFRSYTTAGERVIKAAIDLATDPA